MYGKIMEYSIQDGSGLYSPDILPPCDNRAADYRETIIASLNVPRRVIPSHMLYIFTYMEKPLR